MKKFKLGSKHTFFKPKKIMKKLLLQFLQGGLDVPPYGSKFFYRESLTYLPIQIFFLSSQRHPIIKENNLIMTTVSNFHQRERDFLILNNIPFSQIQNYHDIGCYSNRHVGRNVAGMWQACTYAINHIVQAELIMQIGELTWIINYPL